MRARSHLLHRVVPAAFAAASIALGACGKGPDLTNESTVQIVNVTGTDQGCFGCSYVSQIAIGSSGAYATEFHGTGGGSGAQPKLALLDFPTSSVSEGTWPPVGPQNSLTYSTNGFELAASGGTLFWALGTSEQIVPDGGPTSGGGQQNLAMVYSATEQTFTTSSPANGIALPSIISTTNVNSQPYVMGLTADASSIYVAYAQTENQQTQGGVNETPDMPTYPTGTPSGQRYDGAIARIDRATSVPLLTTGFSLVPGYAFHVLAQNKDSLFWPDYGSTSGTGNGPISIVTQAKASFGAGAPVSFIAVANASQPVLTLVGIAANDTNVAWSAAQPPGSGSPMGCQIWTRDGAGTVTKLYDSLAAGASPAINCYGLAADDRYAYVAIVSEVTPSGIQGQVLAGQGIARVPLAGGALQALPLVSQRWYGPRRVLVDAGFVYAIDPSYVVRFPKSAFSN